VLETHNAIFIHAPAGIVYELAADIPRWPDILDLYRYVRVLDMPDDSAHTLRRRVKMCARRAGIPVQWTASQVLRPDEYRVMYHHVGGVTKGMDADWRIEPRDDGSRVTIFHALTSPRFWLRSGLAEYVLGKVFVEHITDRTLQGIKAQAERRLRLQDPQP
jgi:ribosome-associated toxin RatA of RatAB toxin-antitoxin module